MSRAALGRVAVALDTDDRPTFAAWCARFGSRVGWLKVGLEAFVAWGPWAVETAAGSGARVFLDLKLADIPNTVAGAVRSAGGLGAGLLTVHVGAGTAALRAATEAAPAGLGILGVTVLTHLDAPALDELGMPGAATARVERWAALAASAGCQGVVCSPLEVERVRTRHPPPFLLVTPGIRPAGAERGDQRRTATPREAVGAGADLLVVGRPVTRAADPEAALDALEAELAGAG